MKIGNREFQTAGHTYVMGILNVTPDSFSDGGRWNKMDDALFHAQSMIEEGADILDIGGESARPGYTKISDEEEIARVVPVIEAVKSRFDIPVSVDTYKSKVAKAAVGAGADLVNDIWGLKADEKMAQIIAQADVPCCLMHNRSEAVYSDFLNDVASDLKETLRLAQKAGIREDQIILDPGVGFAKNYEQSLSITNHLEVLAALGYPVLLGTSRKSMIGLTLDLPSDQREEGTMVTTVWAVQKGCMFVRVHNVQANVRTIKMAEALLRR